jgi:hypothetical protein
LCKTSKISNRSRPTSIASADQAIQLRSKKTGRCAGNKKNNDRYMNEQAKLGSRVRPAFGLSASRKNLRVRSRRSSHDRGTLTLLRAPVKDGSTHSPKFSGDTLLRFEGRGDARLEIERVGVTEEPS